MIDWGGPKSHANEQFARRLGCHGVSKSAFEQLVRSPNTKWKDDEDPHETDERYRRWVIVELEGGNRTVRVVYVITKPAAEKTLGSILIISVVVENDNIP